MSRAFVINGDEWGYCIRMSRKCSGANAEGNCMRDECTEIPEWERPKRSLDDLRKAKIEQALKEAEAARKEAELRAKIAVARELAAKRREERAREAAKAAKSAAKPAVRPKTPSGKTAKTGTSKKIT